MHRKSPYNLLRPTLWEIIPGDDIFKNYSATFCNDRYCFTYDRDRNRDTIESIILYDTTAETSTLVLDKLNLRKESVTIFLNRITREFIVYKISQSFFPYPSVHYKNTTCNQIPMHDKPIVCSSGAIIKYKTIQGYVYESFNDGFLSMKKYE